MIFKIPSSVSSLVVCAILLATQGLLLALPVRFLAWDDGIAKRKLGIQSKDQVKSIEDLHPYQRSKPYDATPSDAPLQLVVADRKDSEGNPLRVEIKVLTGVTAGLVIILPDSKHPSGLRTFMIEDSPAKFAWGNVRFVNATGKDLLFRYDKTVVDIPRSWNPVEISPGGSARNMNVMLAAKDNLKDILYSAVWEAEPNVRNLVFVLPSAKPGAAALDLKTISEDRRIAVMEAATKQP